ARSFRRGMVRRIVAGMAAAAREEVALDDLRRALRGTRRDFGSVPPEPLILMDVSYDFPFRVVLKPKVADEWREREADTLLRVHLFRLARAAAGPTALNGTTRRWLHDCSVLHS